MPTVRGTLPQKFARLLPAAVISWNNTGIFVTPVTLLFPKVVVLFAQKFATGVTVLSIHDRVGFSVTVELEVLGEVAASA